MESESQRNESLSISELREGRGLSAGLSSALQRGGVPPWPYECACAWHPGISESSQGVIPLPKRPPDYRNRPSARTAPGLGCSPFSHPPTSPHPRLPGMFLQEQGRLISFREVPRRVMSPLRNPRLWEALVTSFLPALLTVPSSPGKGTGAGA